MALVEYREDGGLAIITIDNPPVNATSAAVRAGLLQAVQRAEAAGIQQGIIMCSGKTFVAGGDVTEFGHAPIEPHLPDVYNTLEASTTVWLAALHGTVLGGGLEFALACDYRIAAQNTRFGFPEVNLGLVPGAGGTQRLPRLIGIELAADMVTSGRLISAADFHKAGGLDAVIDSNGSSLSSARSLLPKPKVL